MEGCICLSNNALNCICNFFQLKYLSLRKTNISKLPRRLGNLKHLETLDIRAILIKKLPTSAKNLSCMKHLLVGHKEQLTRTGGVKFLKHCSGLEMAPGVVKNMTSLQSLAHIVVKDQPLVLRDIGLLQNLRKLKVLIRNVEVYWKESVGSLRKLASFLSSLSIHIVDGKDVSRFTLRNTGPRDEAIEVLGDLPNLLCLKLYHKSYADDCIVFPLGKFTKLSMLVIDNLDSIDRVHCEKGSLPNLERLTLSFLQEPKDGISGLEYLQKLKEIEFFGDIISSVVSKVVSCVKTHPNHPRVIGDKWNIVTEYA
ncbi:hypothetical protein C2845_PM10G03250 [Panicum miliaceum]|uniref:Disease resistance R13L4/SHOC-2-like LRR domain-containing protein n=1 Tax=Panicum miliaceum TaxID=4540 RepID=A0A3L6PJA9_PANMI|nr:hypothetical protein C2845_PM10G03250 [Panicum miliaceum]